MESTLLHQMLFNQPLNEEIALNSWFPLSSTIKNAKAEESIVELT